jgi:addiction module RelB/DinJ family antitoxin
MKTIINIKVDKDVKEKAMKTAKDMGVPLSIIINAFLKQFIRYKNVTFTTSEPSKKLERILKPFFLA